MTRGDIQLQLQFPYDRDRWLNLLKAVLPSTEVFRSAQVLPQNDFKAKSAAQIARIPLADGRIVAVLEVEVAGQVDLQRNRVGLRNLIARFVDQQQAHAVIGLFRGEGEDYRFSFVARSSEIGPDGELSRSETAPRRYTYLLGRGQACRTPTERLVGLGERGRSATMDDLLKAFKVEPLFKEFFHEYGQVFDKVEDLIRPTLPDKEPLRMFTQRLFNRLMFLAFIERKGWLRFGQRTDYLNALWDDHQSKPRREDQSTFYQERLFPLFFLALNNPSERDLMSINRGGYLATLVGNVPYLNGGLFDKDAADEPPGLVVPDEAIAAILDPDNGLFCRYNFTVAESTPLEIDLAVDPEMLGKVFEELVTGRHEQGSYYTPKPIVSFMCRETLVAHLTDRCPKEDHSALEAFVHDHQPGRLHDAEAVLAALRSVTVCDPACGSGAYLLGMLHELLDLRTCLFAANQKLDALTAHERKLEIIERNLYGVDLDPFAVNIARLRLWLSLAVEFEGTVPPPLPNLDFKIEQGDALAAPAPQDLFQRPAVVELQKKKADFLRAHGREKQNLREEIEKAQADLAHWQHVDGSGHGFNWGMEFAEVFLGQTATTTIGGDLNLGHELATTSQRGGFDIIVANPPYVKQELIKEQKPVLKRRFKDIFGGTADLYVFFYARAHELLRPGGIAAFVSSNKWLRAGYGESLRRYLLDEQEFKLVLDFGDLPVFESATAYPCIFVWKKHPRGDSPTYFGSVKELQECYDEGVRNHFVRIRTVIPAEQFGPNKPRFASAVSERLGRTMLKSGKSLGDICRSVMFNGVKTGFNEAFVITPDERRKLIEADPKSEEIIRPYLFGDQLRRFELADRGSYLIYIAWDTDIKKYPAILARLNEFRPQLERRDGAGEKGQCPWFALSRPRGEAAAVFSQPKIVFPDITPEPRFVFDNQGYVPDATAFAIGKADWFLLGVLNSSAVWSYLTQTVATIRGGYLRFKIQYLEHLPIPDASDADRKVVGELAKKVQALHGQRRTRVERFLRDLGLDPAQSTSRNPLEQPWNLSAAEFAKRAKRQPVKFYESARDETAALTEQIAKLEADIDARVATLYGLDAEDQRWAAKSSPSAKSDDKQSLFFGVLGRLKERRPYFRLDEIQTAANDKELALKDSSLNVYLTEAVKQGHIHDAGRGWYSSLANAFELEARPVKPLVAKLEKKFPLLDFTCWSTEQIRAYGHHLLARFVPFVHVDRDALPSVAEFLQNAGYDVHANPRAEAARQFTIREKTVVVRPKNSTQPHTGHLVTIEGLLVELFVESRALNLMDTGECYRIFSNLAGQSRISMASLLDYARERRPAALEFIKLINAEFLNKSV